MIEDSICMKKAKDWYGMLSPVGKLDFIEWLYKTDRHKYDNAARSEPERRFYDGSSKRPTHQEGEAE